MGLFATDLERLAAVVVEHGGPQSHAAILARSLGVPMVGQVADFARLLHPGRRLLVDGAKGEVTLDPAAARGRNLGRRGLAQTGPATAGRDARRLAARRGQP